MSKNLTKSLIVLASLGVFALVANGSVYADDNCETNYGGGETCIFNKSFRIRKEVRVGDSGDFKGKVTDVKENDTVEFRIEVKNVGDVEVDDMKVKDILPKEMERVGGDGLTEYFDNFEPGETKTFKIKAQINDSEFDRENFEKCIVNKAELRHDDEFEGSDTATVCYKKGEVTELPKTGATDTLLSAITGLGFVAAGFLTKKRFS